MKFQRGQPSVFDLFPHSLQDAIFLFSPKVLKSLYPKVKMYGTDNTTCCVCSFNVTRLWLIVEHCDVLNDQEGYFAFT